jgi:hypothetical protein
MRRAPLLIAFALLLAAKCLRAFAREAPRTPPGCRAKDSAEFNPPPDAEITPLQLSLWGGDCVDIQAFPSDWDVAGVRLGFGYAKNWDLKGLDLGVGLSSIERYAWGIQLNAGGNSAVICGGLQGSGAYNNATAMYGVQVTGGVNRTCLLKGIQTGCVNLCAGIWSSMGV